MRYYAMDEAGCPMSTNRQDVLNGWLDRDLVVFDTTDGVLANNNSPIQEMQGHHKEHSQS